MAVNGLCHTSRVARAFGVALEARLAATAEGGREGVTVVDFAG